MWETCKSNIFVLKKNKKVFARHAKTVHFFKTKSCCSMLITPIHAFKQEFKTWKLSLHKLLLKKQYICLTCIKNVGSSTNWNFNNVNIFTLERLLRLFQEMFRAFFTWHSIFPASTPAFETLERRLNWKTKSVVGFYIKSCNWKINNVHSDLKKIIILRNYEKLGIRFR